jgi:hypothetical protein
MTQLLVFFVFVGGLGVIFVFAGGDVCDVSWMFDIVVSGRLRSSVDFRISMDTIGGGGLVAAVSFSSLLLLLGDDTTTGAVVLLLRTVRSGMTIKLRIREIDAFGDSFVSLVVAGSLLFCDVPRTE